MMTLKKLYFTLFITVCFLSSCAGFKVAYNYADWYLSNQVDSYFDINSKQEDFVDDKLEILHQWHRKYELPRYTEFLREVQKKAKDDLSREDAEWMMDQFFAFQNQILEKIAPDAGVFLATVTEEQILYLDNEMTEKRKEREEKLEESVEDLKEERIDELIDSLEDWFGTLSKEQKAKIEGTVVVDQEFRKEGIEHSKRVQKKFVALLRLKKPAQELETELKQWVLDPKSLRNAKYSKMMEDRTKATMDRVMLINSLLTPEQRKKALDKVQEYIDDLEEIAKEDGQQPRKNKKAKEEK